MLLIEHHESLHAYVKCQPEHTWQRTVYKDLSTLYIKYKWFRLAQDNSVQRSLQPAYSIAMV